MTEANESVPSARNHLVRRVPRRSLQRNPAPRQRRRRLSGRKNPRIVPKSLDVAVLPRILDLLLAADDPVLQAKTAVTRNPRQRAPESLETTVPLPDRTHGIAVLLLLEVSTVLAEGK